jgi:DNA-binding XRE family transcriptional regulator
VKKEVVKHVVTEGKLMPRLDPLALFVLYGLSQDDFAKKSGVKYTSFPKIENGGIKKSSVLAVGIIAKVQGVSREDLL